MVDNNKVSELGKVEERLGIDMNLYLLPCKAENGIGFRHITIGAMGMHGYGDQKLAR